MKYRTSKRAERPWWRRLKRAWDRWVEDCTRNDGPEIAPDADVPGLAERTARVRR